MLDKYEHNPEIALVSGNNFYKCTEDIGESYYFSKMLHIWGWATWRRFWSNVDSEMSFWPSFKASKAWRKVITHKPRRRYLSSLFDMTITAKINTFDHQIHADILFLNCVTIVPNVNLIINS